MTTLLLGGMEIEVDENGFIKNPDNWNQAVAEDLAKTEEAYPMTEDSWKVVNFLRNYFLTNGVAPPVRILVKETGLKLKDIYQLFPNGPGRGACKVAGLPRPTGCV